MAKSISDLLNEADDIIEKRASVSTPISSDVDDGTIKLAEDLETWGLDAPKEEAESVKVASVEVDPYLDINEKVAHAIAIIDTVMNLPLVQKIAEFEKKAAEQGFSKEEIDEFVKKANRAKKLETAARWLILPSAAAAGAGGFVSGKKKGKDKGYNQALTDVNKAFEQYNV